MVPIAVVDIAILLLIAILPPPLYLISNELEYAIALSDGGTIVLLRQAVDHVGANAN